MPNDHFVISNNRFYRMSLRQAEELLGKPLAPDNGSPEDAPTFTMTAEEAEHALKEPLRHFVDDDGLLQVRTTTNFEPACLLSDDLARKLASFNLRAAEMKGIVAGCAKVGSDFVVNLSMSEAERDVWWVLVSGLVVSYIRAFKATTNKLDPALVFAQDPRLLGLHHKVQTIRDMHFAHDLNMPNYSVVGFVFDVVKGAQLVEINVSPYPAASFLHILSSLAAKTAEFCMRQASETRFFVNESVREDGHARLHGAKIKLSPIDLGKLGTIRKIEPFRKMPTSPKDVPVNPTPAQILADEMRVAFPGAYYDCSEEGIRSMDVFNALIGLDDVKDYAMRIKEIKKEIRSVLATGGNVLGNPVRVSAETLSLFGESESRKLTVREVLGMLNARL